MSKQQQFLDVIDRDLAETRFHQAISLAHLPAEEIPLGEALGRVLARSVTAQCDVPSFDRSKYDGYAVQARDTIGAQEYRPIRLVITSETLEPGSTPQASVNEREAIPIATGAMLPRGADAVVMVEHTDIDGDEVIVSRAVTSGYGVAHAGSDIAQGETVLRRFQVLTSRETGVLAAIGEASVGVIRKPRVAILSTGGEIIAPGQTMQPSLVFDCNGHAISDAVRELGGEPVQLGIVGDNIERLREAISGALELSDILVLSGGTSKGAGDLCYHVVDELADPGIIVHGVALKPGKPVCLASHHGQPIVVLPGFPTSAIFTFHEFVAPVIRRLGGRREIDRATVRAKLALPVNSVVGRTEYLLVGLTRGGNSEPVAEGECLAAYPMGGGSGSITTFSRADGFVKIERNVEMLAAGAMVDVQLMGRDLQIADLVVIGSHCTGLDFLLDQLQRQGFSYKLLNVGSTGGLEAVRRNECDVAGIHLLDAESGQYNRPFITPGLELISGYGRSQGITYRKGDERFAGLAAETILDAACQDEDCRMVNRNRGSGTRILIDQFLAGRQPSGYSFQVRSHNATTAAIVQGRADWGVAIEYVAKQSGLAFVPLAEERFDLVAPASRIERPAVRALRDLLGDESIQRQLREAGFRL